MNDEPTSSSSHSATPRPLTISDLPDEMLSSIIKELGVSYDVRVYIYDDVRRGDWPSCALVCRRWYRITLPYLFRYIQLPVRKWMDSYADTAQFRKFLEEKPSIAHCVQGLIIGQMSVDIYDFDAILDTLDNLRYLEVILNQFYLDKKDKEWGEWLSTIPRDRTIAKLVYCPDSSYENTKVAARELSVILTPFSEIQRLALEGRFIVAPGDAIELDPGVHGKPSVLELDLLSPILNIRGLQSLQEALSLDRLVCLSVHLSLGKPRIAEDADPESSSQVLEQLLQTVNSTIREVYLKLEVAADLLDAYRALDRLRGSLEACTLLHGFHLKVICHCSLAPLHEPIAHPTITQGWAFGLHILSCITCHSLRHISYAFEVERAWNAPHAPPSSKLISTLDWTKLRQICTSLVRHDMRSIRVKLRVLQNAPTFFGLGSKESLTSRIRRELPDLGDVLRLCDSTMDQGVCKDLPCRWGAKWIEEDNSEVIGRY